MMDNRRDKPYRGYTFDPWPCCQAAPDGYGGRPKAKVICEECMLLLKLGKAAKEKADADRQNGERQPYWFVEQPYAYPYIAGAHRHGKDYNSTLQQALYDLVWAVAEPAEGQPSHSPQKVKKKTTYGSEFEPWPDVISHDAVRGRHDWRKLLVLRPVLRDLFNALDAIIRTGLAEAFQAGKEEGASILFGLASGQKSLNDFDLALLTPEERAEAERKRRGY